MSSSEVDALRFAELVDVLKLRAGRKSSSRRGAQCGNLPDALSHGLSERPAVRCRFGAFGLPHGTRGKESLVRLDRALNSPGH
jgi:hypothetical protein